MPTTPNMVIFNTESTALRDLPEYPVNHGKLWTRSDIDSLRGLADYGVDLHTLCIRFGRTKDSVVAKLVALGSIVEDAGTGQYFYARPSPLLSGKLQEALKAHQESSDTDSQPTEAIQMPNIETKTFIGGQDATTMSDMDIFKKIANLEMYIESLDKIKNKPQKLLAVIEATQADIDELVEYVDSRD